MKGEATAGVDASRPCAIGGLASSAMLAIHGQNAAVFDV